MTCFYEQLCNEFLIECLFQNKASENELEINFTLITVKKLYNYIDKVKISAPIVLYVLSLNILNERIIIYV